MKEKIIEIIRAARPVAGVILGITLGPVDRVLSQPIITRQPADQSVSLAAVARFQVSATSTNPPLTFQWQFGGASLAGQTNASLVLSNSQPPEAGNYEVIVSDLSGGSVTSRTAHLEVDRAFIKVTTGPIVSDLGYSAGGAWGDYNGDGFPDLFVFNANGNDVGSGIYAPFLYRNNGDGTFTKVVARPPVSTLAASYSACWGDYDNDGNLDLLVAATARNLLFRNNGDGTFAASSAGPLLSDSGNHSGVAWIDYNNDGLLDALVTVFDSNARSHNVLYRNNGAGTFTKITAGELVTDVGSTLGCICGDYDNDGYPDLFITGGRGPSTGIKQPNRLYHNNGDGTFTRVSTGAIATDLGFSGPCAWGDYDNDGYLDLFVGNTGGLPNFLYHNNGNGTFTRVTNGVVATDIAGSFGCAWGDYDSDGFLDLFVANYAVSAPTVSFLYHNNGDGTFTKVTAGSPVNDPSDAIGCAWADYDNDGFLDLFVSRDDAQANYLYRNAGNTNGWLAVNLVGRLSNHAAIGARVKVQATIGGVKRWQLRQITGGTGWSGGNELRANFGLGDATNVDLVRIEWPSGIVQTLTNVAPRQFLTIVEHQVAVPKRPVLADVARAANGVVNLSAVGDPNLLYLLEASTNLVNWTWLGVRSNATGTVQFSDPWATNYTSRFYRVTVP
jgi:hypothetical protein